MALSNTEKQRRYRERQRAKRAEELKTADQFFGETVNRTPFFKSFQDDGNLSDFHLYFDIMCIDAPDFKDDSGPKSMFGLVEDAGDNADPYDGAHGSLGRAEVMVGCLLDAATTLAEMVRRHKLREIDARIKDFEKELVLNPSAAPTIAQQLANLVKMREDLQHSVRWTVPNWQTALSTG
ncbi:hypothetical protein [Loktanella sp. R86503]|uniref:hypothetical protein n=1 Tax=Loktanella sp. R86503 TaxID=3093847 RepID=UPI0036D96987